jgi:hypothetical protein
MKSQWGFIWHILAVKGSRKFIFKKELVDCPCSPERKLGKVSDASGSIDPTQ